MEVLDGKSHIFDVGGGREIELDYDDIINIFKGYRPKSVDKNDFKIISRILKKEVESSLKEGTLFHLSKVSREMWETYYQKGLVNRHSQRGYTYVNPVNKKQDEERDRDEEDKD